MKKCGAALVLWLLIAGIAVPVSSWGQSRWEGMDMVQYCTGDTVLFDDTACQAYLQGVIDAFQYYNVPQDHPKAFCLPEDQEARKKGKNLFPKWLETFKERLFQKPIRLAVDGLNAIFPCRPSKR